ncbi:MAG: hypothetical protein WBR18_06215 [Anaerolineales bacterium]
MKIVNESHGSTYRLALGLSLISGGLLGLEILYVRMVSILLFPVATFLVISLALLGLGASGGLMSLLPADKINRRLLGLGATGFSYAILLSLAAMWYASESYTLAMLLPVLLSIPMFFGGIALSGVFSLPASRIPILYFADLVGAGASALLVLVALNYLGGVQVALLTGALGLLSAAIFFGRKGRIWALSSLLLFGALLGLSSQLPNGMIPISPKELRLIHRIDGEVDWEYQGWSALARVDVLSVPGDVLQVNGGLPYKLVTHDGGAPSLLLHVDSSTERQLIDDTIFGVPYWIKEAPDVLVIGLGGGPDVVAALAGGAASVTGAEVSPEMIAIVRDHFAEYVGDPYADPRVHIELTDGRHLLASSEDRYDLIQLTGVDTTVASLGGNPNLAENYLYTREAFVEYLDHLNDGGLLSVSFPNVEGLGLRLVALTSQALRAKGVTDFRDHVIVGEMTGYVHVLVSNDPFEPADIETLKEHYQAHPTSVHFPLYHRLFGQPAAEFIAESRLVLVPGDPPAKPYAGFVDALAEGDEENFLTSQPYELEPPTDEWPFFFVLDKFGFRTPNYDALFLTLGALLFFSVLLMIVPPWILRRRGKGIRKYWSVITYFACLGLGFIFVEVVSYSEAESYRWPPFLFVGDCAFGAVDFLRCRELRE